MVIRCSLIALVLSTLPSTAKAEGPHELTVALLVSPLAYHQVDGFSTHWDFKGIVPLGAALTYEYRAHRYFSVAVEADYFHVVEGAIDGFDLPVIARGILPLGRGAVELWAETGFGFSLRATEIGFQGKKYGLGWTTHAGLGFRYRFTPRWATSFRAALHFASHEAGDRHVEDASLREGISLMFPSLTLGGSYRF